MMMWTGMTGCIMSRAIIALDMIQPVIPHHPGLTRILTHLRTQPNYLVSQEVAAMDSCSFFVRTHQHGILVTIQRANLKSYHLSSNYYSTGEPRWLF